MKGMTYRNDKTGEATVEHTCDARAVFDKLAIIVVTYKRSSCWKNSWPHSRS